MTSYLIAIATSAGFYVLLALALNLQWGITGLVNFGVAGFYAIGAYASALATERLGLPVALALPLAACIGAVAALGLAGLSARLSGDYLAIVTLGFAEVVRLIAMNEDWLTRGPRGMGIATQPLPAGLSREAYALAYLGLVLAAVLVAFWALERMRRAPFGRVLRAIREDALVPATLGRDVQGFRLRAFAIGGALMAASGSLYAHWVLSISPDHFQTPVTIVTWMAVVIGGAGNNRGLVLGAFLVVSLLEGTRFLGGLLPGLDAERLSALRIVLIGVLLIAAIRLRPQGLLPEERIRAEDLAAPQQGDKT
jgi:branched-chain amino acid transport system permease protein